MSSWLDPVTAMAEEISSRTKPMPDEGRTVVGRIGKSEVGGAVEQG